jgi:DNA-binding LytR/AlgR family response regulator
MKLRCIITDDEPMARKGLQGYVAKVPFLELAAVCEDTLQLEACLHQTPADLLFLDIEMPGRTGIDFLKARPGCPPVVFTTAYANYALEGFELDVIDYLLKPISFDRFLRSVNKAAAFHSSLQTPPADFLFLKAEGRLEKVLFSEIHFIEALENYMAVHTGGRRLLVHATLKSLQERLPPSFLQPHKSYLVNPDHISAVEGNTLRLGSHSVPVSKYQKEAVWEKLINRHLLGNGK